MLLNFFKAPYRTYASLVTSSTKPCVLTHLSRMVLLSANTITCSTRLALSWWKWESHFLWSDDLLKSAYLLNFLPSSPLGGEVPLHRLHPDCDLFSLPPLMFGFVAFVHDHTTNTFKLASHSIKGVFFGCSCMLKGYLVYFLD